MYFNDIHRDIQVIDDLNSYPLLQLVNERNLKDMFVAKGEAKIKMSIQSC